MVRKALPRIPRRFSGLRSVDGAESLRIHPLKLSKLGVVPPLAMPVSIFPDRFFGSYVVLKSNVR